MRARWILSPMALAAACTQAPSAKPAETAQAPALLGDCVTAVLASKAGTIVKLEGKTENGVAVYEFDVRSPDGTQWDVECDAVAAKVTEVEQEVNAPTDEPFASKVKISADSAKAIALATYPGIGPGDRVRGRGEWRRLVRDRHRRRGRQGAQDRGRRDTWNHHGEQPGTVPDRHRVGRTSLTIVGTKSPIGSPIGPFASRPYDVMTSRRQYAGNPVISWPRISPCTSCVPS